MGGRIAVLELSVDARRSGDGGDGDDIGAMRRGS
jgi:hypothetical protein